MTDIIFTRPLLTAEEMYGELSRAGSSEPSLGLCYLAAATRENGYKTEIIDAIALKLKNDELAREIAKKSPAFVGVSAVTLSAHNAGDLAEKIKKINKNIKIIAGGVHITAAPIETMEKFPCFDIGIIGEGETTIVELLGALKDNQELENIPGLILRKNSGFKITPKRQLIRNLDKLPLPAWDLLPDLHKYYGPPAWSLDKGASALLISSRGCSNACIYCDRGCFGEFVRAHSADYFMRMVKDLRDNYGVKQFRINDDNFILFKPRLKEICGRLIDEKLNIKWSCFARADNIDIETIELMKKAGCWQISYGVETGSQEIHDLEKKNITLEQIEKAIKLTKKAGIRTIGFAMIGHPKETSETVKATINFSKKLALDDFKIVYLTPYPGTPLYDCAEKYGRLNKDWKKMNAYTEPCFIPYGLTKEDLIKYRRLMYRKFYFRPKIIFSYISQIRSPYQLMVLLKGFISLVNLFFHPVKFIPLLKNLPLIDLGAGKKRHSTKSKLIALNRAEKFYEAGDNALDLGCGDGYWSEKLKKIGYEVISLDSEKKYSDAKVIDANDILPFPDKYFSLCWSADVIEHLDDPANAAKEINRVLKDNGNFIVTTPNSYFWLYYFFKIFGLSAKDLQRPDHKHFFHYNDMLKFFPEAEIFGFFPYAILKFKIKNPSLVKWLSPTFIIISAKNLWRKNVS